MVEGEVVSAHPTSILKPAVEAFSSDESEDVMIVPSSVRKLKKVIVASSSDEEENVHETTNLVPPAPKHAPPPGADRESDPSLASTKPRKDPNAPKRPATAYRIFIAQKKSELLSGDSSMKKSDAHKYSSEMWKTMSAELRAPYEELAKIEREKYRAAMTAYRASKGLPAGKDGGSVSRKRGASESDTAESSGVDRPPRPRDAKRELLRGAEKRRRKAAKLAEKEDSDSGGSGVAGESPAHVVDADCPNRDDYSLFSDEAGLTWSAIVGKVADGEQQDTDVYVFQILIDEITNEHALLIKTKAPNSDTPDVKLNEMQLSKAKDQFKREYHKASGERWGPTKSKSLKKAPTKSGVPSQLNKQVFALVEEICGTERLLQDIKALGVDTTRLALKDISRQTITQAYEVLSELQTAVLTNKTIRLAPLTAEFYKIIPHHFGKSLPPTIASVSMIQQKTALIGALDNIIACRDLPVARSGKTNPVDAQYTALRAALTPVATTDEAWAVISDMVCNTHAPTHTGFRLKLQAITKVSRQGEVARFSPFRRLHNHRMLWHGTRLSCCAGILSQGLRVPVAEAPTTGFMFGKGIYFSDIVSKSALDCHASPSDSEAVLLLCEVALGDMIDVKEETYTRPSTLFESMCHSVRGVGRMAPDEDGDTYLDSCRVHTGPSVPTPHSDSKLRHNEYIVYDAAQVLVRYIVHVKFEFGELDGTPSDEAMGTARADVGSDEGSDEGSDKDAEMTAPPEESSSLVVGAEALFDAVMEEEGEAKGEAEGGESPTPVSGEGDEKDKSWAAPDSAVTADEHAREEEEERSESPSSEDGENGVGGYHDTAGEVVESVDGVWRSSECSERPMEETLGTAAPLASHTLAPPLTQGAEESAEL